MNPVTSRRRPTRRSSGRRKLDEVVAPLVADALAVIAEHYTGKAYTSRAKTFLAIYELCLDAFAIRGDADAQPADRAWLARQAGVHIETLDRCAKDLERLGLIKVERRRIPHRPMNYPNRWNVAGRASLDPLMGALPARIPDTSTKTSHPQQQTDSLALRYVLKKGPTSTSPRARARRRHSDFQWDDPAGHPALHGLPPELQRKIANIYELVRDDLLAAGVESVPQGGWLVGIRDAAIIYEDHLDTDFVCLALDAFIVWRDEGGSLAYSFGWMHKFRTSPSPPPSLLFSAEAGDPDDRSNGEPPLSLWAEHGAHLNALWADAGLPNCYADSPF